MPVVNKTASVLVIQSIFLKFQLYKYFLQKMGLKKCGIHDFAAVLGKQEKPDRFVHFTRYF
jgi:hypothetical protein